MMASLTSARASMPISAQQTVNQPPTRCAPVVVRPDVSRRRIGMGALGAPLLLLIGTQTAHARDAQAAARAKEERKAQLRAAASEMKETGKTEAVFGDSSYAVGEDHTTPNTHTRQEEGARTSK